MGLRSSSLAKKNDDTLTWVLHKKDPSQQELGHKSNEKENENILRKSYDSSTTSEYQERRHNNSNNNNNINNGDNNHVPRKRRTHVHSNILDYGESEQTYGYGITDLDDFLSKASIARPGNIPMVLCTGCLLYQTQLDDHYQTEVALPLGMVVNAVFKDQQWLYVQTPHAEEGYIPYGSCLPLGIVPPPDAARAPCWETQSDVFPRPLGDRRHLRHHHHRAQHHQHHHHHHQPAHQHHRLDDDDDDDYHHGGDGDRGDYLRRRPHRHRHRRHRHRRRVAGTGRWSSLDVDSDDFDDGGGGGGGGRALRFRATDHGTDLQHATTTAGSVAPARSVTGYGYI